MDTFFPAEAGDAGFAPQAIEDDPDLFLGPELPAGLTLDLPNNRFRGTSLFACHSFLLAWFCDWKP